MMATPKKRGPKGGTSTSNFGVGKRESHDASAFYERFEAPTVSGDDDVPAPYVIAEPFVEGDARHMDSVLDNSVALVVTSPPYFAGKQYEEELERDGVPSSYVEYLQLLTDVFAECARKLEPGHARHLDVADDDVEVVAALRQAHRLIGTAPVSYTHLTLPTNREV